MNPILQTLLTMTATASVAALCVMVLRLLLKKAPRWILCCLWAVVFLRMVCPVSFSLPVSLIPAPIAQGTYLATAPAREEAPVAPSPIQEEAPSPVLPATEPALPSAPQEESPALSWSDLVTSLWLLGAGGMLLWGGVSYLRLRRKLAEAVLLRDNIYESDQIGGPFVCGFFRPRIYLPAGMAAGDWQYVLLHEQAHIRRRDHWVKPLAWVALCLHWCNPLLWLSYRLLCRDIETACDQAVIRSFDPDHTVQYATTLLHLGHKTSLPQAVPLAFGEEDPKGRIRHVLDYQHPRLWVAVTALVVCVVAAVLMLANPGKQGAQLEGVSITESAVQQRHISLPLPEALQRDLVALVRDYDREDYTPLESYTPADGSLCLSDPNGGTQFYLDATAGDYAQLVRVNHDGYSATRKLQVLDASFCQDQRWRDFVLALDTYLNTGWGKEVYACKTPYLGDAPACQALLEALHVSQAVGPYTISLQTETEPYSITLQFEQAVSPDTYPYVEYYLAFCGLIFCNLVDNAGEFCWDLPAQESNNDQGISSVSGSKAVFDSFTQFQPYWKKTLDLWLENGSPLTAFQGGGTYQIAEVLYWADDLGPSEAYLPSTSFVVQSDRFAATLVNVLSSAWPVSDDYATPVCISKPLSTLKEIPGLKELSLDDYLDCSLYQVLDSQGNETNYYYCELDRSFYIAHTTVPGDPQSTDYVVRLAGENDGV